MYFNLNFNVLFKLINVHLFVSELYIIQTARCNDKKRDKYILIFCKACAFGENNEKIHNIGLYLFSCPIKQFVLRNSLLEITSL